MIHNESFNLSPKPCRLRNGNNLRRNALLQIFDYSPQSACNNTFPFLNKLISIFYLTLQIISSEFSECAKLLAELQAGKNFQIFDLKYILSILLKNLGHSASIVCNQGTIIGDKSSKEWNSVYIFTIGKVQIQQILNKVSDK